MSQYDPIKKMQGKSTKKEQFKKKNASDKASYKNVPP